MSKVEIVGPKSLYFDVLVAIHQQGILQIEDISQIESVEQYDVRPMSLDPQVEEEIARLQELLSKINSMIATLSVPETTPPPPRKQPSKRGRKAAHEEPVEEAGYEETARYYEAEWKKTPQEIHAIARELTSGIEDRLRELAERRNELEAERASLARYETIVSKIEPLARKYVSLEGYETMALLVERKHRVVFDAIKEEIAKITNNRAQLISADIDDKTTGALLFFPAEYASAIRSYLWAENVSQLKLPDLVAGRPVSDALKTMREYRRRIPAEIKKIQKEIDAISRERYAHLVALQHVIEDRLEELKVTSLAGQTEFAFVIIGWVPTKYLKMFRTSLRNAFHGRVAVNVLPLTDEDRENAPVVLENPAWAKPFEIAMRLFSPPKYGTVDPTPFVAIFYPIFFGIILGDIGYGAVLLAITLWVRRKYRDYAGIKAVASMLMMAAVMTMFFGFLYGEVFGNLPEQMHWIREVRIPIGAGFTLPFNRSELVMPFIYFSLGLGAMQLMLGQVIGLINAIREKAQRHGMEKVGMLALFTAVIVLILAYVLRLPASVNSVAYFLLAIAVGLLAYGGGIGGIVHMFGAIGKVFSYLRLMALGLAGVILAEAANQMAGSMGSIGAGLLVATLIHLINLVFHTFSSSIHALRLNFIEFFDQFYEYGGKEYRPLKRVGR